MGRRFGDIENAGVLKLALDNLTKYRADAATRQSSRITGTGTPKNRIQVKVAITPFYVPGVTDIAKSKFIVNASKAALDADTFGKTEIAKYYDATPPDAATPRPKGYQPSRARIFDPSGTTASYTKSKYTGLYYAKRAGTGYSFPIGRKAAGDFEEAVQSAIKTALTSVLNAEPYRRISFTDEIPPPSGTIAAPATV